MQLLWAGLALFFGAHLLPSTPLRGLLVSGVGAKPYKLAFTLLSVLGLVLIVIGYRQAPVEMVFAPKPWAWTAAKVLMPIAFVLLAAANMPGYIRKWLRHPMMLGTLLWSALHYFANGERAAVWLFGSFMLYSVFSIISSTLRGQQSAAAAKPVAVRFDVIAIVAGLALYAVILHAHGWLFNRSLMG